VSRIVMGIGSVFVILSLIVLLAPDVLVSAADWEARSAQYLGGAARIVFGVVFVLAAPSTRHPKGMRVFGALLVVAGLGLAVMPNENWADLVRFWLVDNLPAYRYGGALVGLLLGSFLIRTSRPERATV